MLGDATQVQYDDEGDENELEEMMEQNPAASLMPVNMIMVRGAKHRKFLLKNKISINSVKNFFFHIIFIFGNIFCLNNSKIAEKLSRKNYSCSEHE